MFPHDVRTMEYAVYHGGWEVIELNKHTLLKTHHDCIAALFSRINVKFTSLNKPVHFVLYIFCYDIINLCPNVSICFKKKSAWSQSHYRRNVFLIIWHFIFLLLCVLTFCIIFLINLDNRLNRSPSLSAHRKVSKGLCCLRRVFINHGFVSVLSIFVNTLRDLRC